MKKVLLIVGLCLLLVLGWDWNVFGRRQSAENIMAVRPGMTMAEVRSLLGDPIDVSARGPSQFVCQCNLEKTCAEISSTTYIYTRKPRSRYVAMFLPFEMSYPMLWVHFNSRGKVKEVYVKRYVGIERRPIYVAALSPCDTTDRTIATVEWAESDSVALGRLKEFF